MLGDNKSVAIILAFYNGRKYIKEQVDSILSQSHKRLKLYIYDDNSPLKLEKSFLNLSKEFEKKVSIIRRSENMGHARNFLFGLKEIEEDYDFYGFSDQDDIWNNNKIEDAIKDLSKKDYLKPTLYCSRTDYYNEDCTKKIGESKIFNKKPTFANALIQNIVGGNTIVFNNKAKNLIVNSLNEFDYFEHDWWTYQIISASGGEIIFSSQKTLKYRQHSNNITGRNDRLNDKIKRLKKFFLGNFKSWNDINIANLKRNTQLVKKQNLKILHHFIKARNSKNIITRIIYYFKSGVFRQSNFENFIFFIGVIFKRL